MIKAEDLRIGDLVRISEDLRVEELVRISHVCLLEQGTICTVSGIHAETAFKEEKKGVVSLIPINSNDNRSSEVRCNDIEGIPLTCSNLSNNGWGASQIGEHEFLIYNEDEDIYLEWSDIGDRYTFNDFLRSKIFITVRYIHELQHILWALGKDANLKI